MASQVDTSQVVNLHPDRPMDLSSANDRFAWQLYLQLSPLKENILFSPFSLSIAMGMTYLGTKSETADQIKNTMNYGALEDSQIHEGYYQMISDLLRQNIDYIKIHVANRLFGQTGYTFLRPFLDGTVQYYNAEFGQVDFRNSEAVRAGINNWVEQQTADKITNLIGPGVLTDDTKLVLVNAIYFKGSWVQGNKFDKYYTHAADFYVSDKETVKVDMMHKESDYPIGWNEELKCHLLELPYDRNALSLFILLPADKHGLKSVEEKLSENYLHHLEANFKPRSEKIRVWLPKFVLESDFSLNNTLSAMGMPDLFIEGKADLSGISEQAAKKLFVTALLHKAFMEVNEEGTEAAAATAVVYADNVSFIEPPKLRVDHPFLFLIRSNTTKSILFLGRMQRPPVSKTLRNQ